MTQTEAIQRAEILSAQLDAGVDKLERDVEFYRDIVLVQPKALALCPCNCGRLVDLRTERRPH